MNASLWLPYLVLSCSECRGFSVAPVDMKWWKVLFFDNFTGKKLMLPTFQLDALVLLSILTSLTLRRASVCWQERFLTKWSCQGREPFVCFFFGCDAAFVCLSICSGEVVKKGLHTHSMEDVWKVSCWRNVGNVGNVQSYIPTWKLYVIIIGFASSNWKSMCVCVCVCVHCMCVYVYVYVCVCV